MKTSFEELYTRLPDLLAPSMAKDHPNLPVVKEEGCYYYGTDGKKYLDFTSGIAVANTGHRHPKVVKAIKEGADKLMHGPSGVIMYDSILRVADRLKVFYRETSIVSSLQIAEQKRLKEH